MDQQNTIPMKLQVHSQEYMLCAQLTLDLHLRCPIFDPIHIFAALLFTRLRTSSTIDIGV